MALFKIFKGLDADLSKNKPNTVEGYCYFTTDTGKMYVDIQNGANTAANSQYRVCLNAAKADVATKLGTAGVGSSTIPIYLSAGSPVACGNTLGVNITGNSGSSTKLQTGRKINGTSFNGTADITTANWGTARTIKIGESSQSINGSADITYTPFAMRLTKAEYGKYSSMNAVADTGNSLGMADLTSTNNTINPGGATGWHHYINMTWSDATGNNGSATNEWCTQIANRCGTTDLWVRSRSGGTIADGTAWVAPWTRILTGSNYSSVLDGNYVRVAGDNMNGYLGFKSNYLIKPVAEYRTTNGAHTGAITITLPADIGNTMVSMWIDVYNYTKDTSFSVHVGGYTYSNATWEHNPFATVYGADYKVRLGHNGTNFVVYIGETNSTWSYPQISVRDVILGYSPTYSNWRKNWTVSFSTSFSNVTYEGSNRVITTKNYTSLLDGRYVNVSGDTMTGHLNATAGLSWNHANWAPSGNIYCNPTANGQEWSIDVGNTSYTGSMWHVWSTRLGATMLACYADNRHVEIPVHLYVGGYNNTSYALSTSSFICQSWIRTTGSTGWYNESYGGGWYMTDSTFVRTYNNKPVLANNSYYVGTTAGGGTGLALYGTSAPNSYGIHMSLTSSYGKHGEVQGDWANYFCFDGATNRGWIFKQANVNVASISGAGHLSLNGQYRRAGHSSSWVGGRDGALVRMTSCSGYSPTISAKTPSGSWEIGTYDNAGYAERLIFSYAADANYNSNTNTSNSAVTIANNGRLYGAAWNDYAEYRNQQDIIEPGYCVASSDDGKVYKTTEMYQACDGIVSDTFGFAIGETEECITPLAVAGRVLAYCSGDRYSYHTGDTVCAGPGGLIYKMSREEIKEWPDRIVGIVSEIPEYKTWGTSNVEVNDRIWIKIK